MRLRMSYECLLGSLLALHAGGAVADEFPQPLPAPYKAAAEPAETGSTQTAERLAPCRMEASNEVSEIRDIVLSDEEPRPERLAQEDEYCAGGGTASNSGGGGGGSLTANRPLNVQGAQVGTASFSRSGVSSFAPGPVIAAAGGGSGPRFPAGSGTLDESERSTPPTKIVRDREVVIIPGWPPAQPSTPPRDAACFLRGTRILTPQGERKVEDLRIGDLVTTASGDKPIKWIPRQLIKRAPWEQWSAGVAPVVIEKDAIAQGLPNRRLCISPLHMLRIDGAFVEARELVNGTTIVRDDPEGDLIEYFNIELNGHAIIYANGIAVETFNPNSILHRESFENFAQYVSLYPGEEYTRYPQLASRKNGSRSRLTAMGSLARLSKWPLELPLSRLQAAFDRSKPKSDIHA